MIVAPAVAVGVFGIVGALLVVLVVTVASAIEIVDATERRVLTVFGEYETVLEPGLNVVPPFVSRTYSLPLDSAVEVDLGRTQTATPHGPVETYGTATVSIDDADELLEATDDPSNPVRGVVRGAMESQLESLDNPNELGAESFRIGVGAEAPGVRVDAMDLRIDYGSPIDPPQ